MARKANKILIRWLAIVRLFLLILLTFFHDAENGSEG